MAELKVQQEYADFIAARYAGMAGDTPAAAGYYRRAFDNEPLDSSLLERATFATLISGDAGEASRLVAKASPEVARHSPTAQLVMVVDEIGAGKGHAALQRLRNNSLGAINSDMAGFLSAWLASTENMDKGLVELAQVPTRRMLAAEQATIQGLMFLNAGRDDRAIEAFNQAQRLPLGSSDIVMSLNARLLASRGEFDAARKLVAMEIEEKGESSLTDYITAQLETGRAVPRPKLSLRYRSQTLSTDLRSAAPKTSLRDPERGL